MVDTLERPATAPVIKELPVRDRLRFLRRTYEEFGEIYTIKAGRLEMVVMAGLDANRFLSENGKDCLTSTVFWGEALNAMECPHSIIGVDGDVHQHQRSILMPHFLKSKFTGSIPGFARIFERTLAAHYGTRALVAPLLRHVVSQQIGSTMQGYLPTSAEVETLIQWEQTALKACAMKRVPMSVVTNPKYQAVKREMKQLAEKILSLQGDAGGQTYLDDVINKAKKARPEWFTDGDIRAHAVMPFIAGTDTVGAELTFAVRELLMQPDLRQRLQEEVDDVFGRGIPDATTLEGMVTLRNFCREVLRLYPNVYVLRRDATRDFTFKGHLVRKGQPVILFSTADHTNPAYFKDPYRFDIDRYNPPRSERPPSGALAPFGMGTHTCMGAGLANVLMPLNVSLLLYCTDMKPASDVAKIKPTHATPGLTLNRRFALHLEQRRRLEGERQQSPAAAANGDARTAAQSPDEIVQQPPTGCRGHRRAQNGAVRIAINRDLCNGHGRCMAHAPELFCVGSDGKMDSLVHIAEGPLADKARTAAANCPASAIRIVDPNKA